MQTYWVTGRTQALNTRATILHKMPSGASLGRCRFNSSAHPITIEITSFQHAPSPVSANNPEAISLTASPYRNPFKAQRPFTAESDNRTVCLELPEQADDTFQKKYPSVPSPADEDQGIEAILHSEQNNPNGGGGSEPRSTPYPTTRRLDLIILPLTSLIYVRAPWYTGFWILDLSFFFFSSTELASSEGTCFSFKIALRLCSTIKHWKRCSLRFEVLCTR